MYRKKNHEQAEFESFHLSFGGRLRSDNRWVKLSKIVPWEQIERRYTVRLNEDRGAPALSARIALGSLIIKEKLGLSDEETVEQIRENPYLQYFLGYEAYRDEQPFDPSMMVHFRKRLGGEIVTCANHRRRAGRSKYVARVCLDPVTCKHGEQRHQFERDSRLAQRRGEFQQRDEAQEPRTHTVGIERLQGDRHWRSRDRLSEERRHYRVKVRFQAASVCRNVGEGDLRILNQSGACSLDVVRRPGRDHNECRRPDRNRPTIDHNRIIPARVQHQMEQRMCVDPRRARAATRETPVDGHVAERKPMEAPTTDNLCRLSSHGCPFRNIVASHDIRISQNKVI